jgi:hypothetical protein
VDFWLFILYTGLMKTKDLILHLQLTEVVPCNAESQVLTAYTSDLLSDVMGNAQDGSALITIQAHKNTIAVATLISCPLVIICNAREVPQEMIDAAIAEDIAIAQSTDNQFTVSGRLFALFVGV